MALMQYLIVAAISSDKSQFNHAAECGLLRWKKQACKSTTTSPNSQKSAPDGLELSVETRLSVRAG